MATTNHEEQLNPLVTSVGFLYEHLVAVAMGFALFVLVTNVFHFGVLGVMSEAFDLWVQAVRPAVAIPFELTIAQLPAAWQLALPTLVVDYLAVGVGLILWSLRYVRAMDLSAFPMALFHLFLWPLFFIFMPQIKVYVGTKRGVNREVGWLEWAPPLIYLAVFLAANVMFV
jgi:hypothetical protein